MLTVTDLSVRLPGRRRRWTTVLDRIQLTLAPGQTCAVVGETGAGKSMLVAALTGLLPAGAQTSGSARLGARSDARLDEVELLTATARTWSTIRGRRIGLLSQQAAFSPLRTIRAQLREVNPVADLIALAEGCGLDPALLHRYSNELSGGQLRRAALVSALLHSPPVLLADEPTTGLGLAELPAVLDALRSDADRATLVITHDLQVAKAVADDIIVMRDGRIEEPGPYTERLWAASRLEGL